MEEEDVVREEHGFALARTGQQGNEMALAGQAARAKAEIESAYVIAMNRPRSVDTARLQILQACRRPAFADSARYKKPVGNKQIEGTGEWVKSYAEGPSIRFIETAIQAYRNIRATASVVFEDDEKRIISVTVTDLENNLSFTKEVTIKKIVERNFLKKGAVVIYERENTNGKKVYGVQATEDEMLVKQGAIESKLIRENGRRLIPQDIIEEAMEVVDKTIHDRTAKDPEAAKKAVLDAFASLNVMPGDLEEYLGHSVRACSPAEISDLRKVYTTINSGEATWQSYIDKKTGDDGGNGKSPEKGKVPNMKPGPTPEPKGKPKMQYQTSPELPKEDLEPIKELMDEPDPLFLQPVQKEPQQTEPAKEPAKENDNKAILKAFNGLIKKANATVNPETILNLVIEGQAHIKPEQMAGILAERGFENIDALMKGVQNKTVISKKVRDILQAMYNLAEME